MIAKRTKVERVAMNFIGKSFSVREFVIRLSNEL